MPCAVALLILIIHNVPDGVIKSQRNVHGSSRKAWSEDIMWIDKYIMMFGGVIQHISVSKDRAGEVVEGYTSTCGIVPALIRGNPLSCTDMVCASRTFLRIKKDSAELPPSAYAGIYTLGSCGTLTITATGDTTIAWSSDVDVTCIFIKGGPGGNSYGYDPPSRSDGGLSTPLDTLDGKPRLISYINICYTLPASVL